MPRSSVYALLTLVAVGLIAGRLASTTTQTIRANDRSRWCTVRALVHDGTYAIGRRTILPDGTYRDEGIIVERGWGTLDKVLDPETHIYYSDKPPLFPTAVAGVYWVVRKVTGWSIIDDQLAVVWSVLVVVNLVPFVLYCLLLGRMVERFGLTGRGRLYVFVAGCFGTFVTTFQVVLNNHTPATCAAMAVLYYVTGGRRLDSGHRLLRCTLAGFFAGIVAACDLPATTLLVCVSVWAVRQHGLRAGLAAVGAGALPVAAWLLTNYLAIGQLRPAYAHEGSAWYLYDGSLWRVGPLDGIDRAGEVEGKFDYAANLILGHHGIFSLTPIFALAIWGFFNSFRRPQTVATEPPTGPADRSGQRFLTHIIWVTILLTVVVCLFYVSRSSNYGGVGVGLRWFLWLTPLFLVSMLPTADELCESRTGRILAGCVLIVSVFSASYYATDPWSHHPWLYDLMCHIDPTLRYPAR